MDISQTEEFAEKLLPLLKKILQSKRINDVQMSKILSSIDDKLRIQHLYVENIFVISEFLSETLENWKKTRIDLSEAQFICRFIELLSKYHEAFHKLQSTNDLNDLISILKQDLLKHTPMKLTLVKMLHAILDNSSGCTWIKTSQMWKMVVSIYLSNENLYIEREVIKFFTKLISITKTEENIIEDILSHVFLPIQEKFKATEKDKILSRNILLFLKLLEIILKVNIFSQKSGIDSKMGKFCNLEIFLKSVIENSEQEITLAALQSLVLWSVVKSEDKRKLLSAEDIPAVFDLFNFLTEKNKFNCIIKFAKYCQILWNEIGIQMHSENAIGVNFILIQLLPSLISINMPVTDKEYDLFNKKLFGQKSPQFQKYFHLLGSKIKSNFNSKPDDLAVKGILSVITSLENYNFEEAVLILQSMLLITNSLIVESGYDLETAAKKYKKLRSEGIKNKSLLLTILNSIPLLLEKFKINWTDLEALGLFKITQCLLKISTLPCLVSANSMPSQVVSQTLVVVKVAILNCILPNTALNSIYTNFESVASIIYEHMTNSSWEIRDTCIEVVIAIAELSESKLKGFEQVLQERNFPSLLLHIVENDAESYVRASAIRALTTMTKIEILNPFLKDQDSCLKVTKLLETESEGIVRREAALLIKEIYLTLNDQHSDLINIFYKVMGGVALSDLYWEVKINSLIFWEAVIQRTIADQTVINEPPTNTAVLNKEVINFSEDNKKLDLDKFLKKLSKIGCLYVLMTILKDDCDMIVIEKSAEVLSHLLNILKDYNVIGTANFSGNSVYRKRKNTGLMESESNKIPNRTGDNECDTLEESISMSFTKSDQIIEEIVNETDINLLKKVPCHSEEINCCNMSVFLKEIEPEAFLLQMQRFDKDQFLENKQKSFTNVDTDLTLTMQEINIEHLVTEINIMDCY